MDEVIRKAIDKGYAEIAFSDHFDLVPSEIAIYGVPSYYGITKSIDQMRQKYPSIRILKGVELGEYHNCYKTVDKILSIDPPDVKIGAIHILHPLEEGSKMKVNISLPLKHDVTPRLIRAYYRENLDLVKHGGFDILAHLGVYKRYLSAQPDESCAQDIIEEIFRIIIEKGIILEVNLSGRRKRYGNYIPEIGYLEKYYRMGGRKISIGSDTHSIDDFDEFFDEATTLLIGELGFQGARL